VVPETAGETNGERDRRLLGPLLQRGYKHQCAHTLALRREEDLNESYKAMPVSVENNTIICMDTCSN
jgi:hypothetical protein